MLLPVRHLLLRLRAPGSRGEEVKALRRRLGAAGKEAASEETAALAAELRRLRVAVTEAFAGVRACGGCAAGRSLPHGRWRGGFCCGGRTEGVFDEDEVAALALGGTRARHLRVPLGDHAGCAFRGDAGCSLGPADRPNVCARYACRELQSELTEDGEWPRVRALTRQLDETYRRFVASRATGGRAARGGPSSPP